MRIFGEKVNVTFVKDILAALLIIPTFLGGIWQIAELVAMDASFLRFFSISQLISDGLLVLFVLLVCVLSLGMYIGFGILFTDTIEIKESARITLIRRLSKDSLLYRTKRVSVRDIIFECVFFLVMTGLALGALKWYVIPELTVRFKKMDRLSLTFLCIASAMITIPCYTVIESAKRLYDNTGLAINFRHISIQARKKKIYVVLAFFSMVVILYGVQYLHQLFLVADNLKNKEYIAGQLKANNPKLESWCIYYINDKYIFVYIQDSTCKYQIEVLPFEVMFPEKSE